MFEPFIPITLPTQEDAVQIAKSHIRGILDSYHGEWDFLIELLQNAVDALDVKFNDSAQHPGEKPQIEVIINEKSGTVRVSDNGIGMDDLEAKRILRPNYTNKPYYGGAGSKRSLRGHKGVGLTFLAFNYNSLKYCTKQPGQFFSGEITNGKTWVDSEDETSLPKVIPADYDPEFL